MDGSLDLPTPVRFQLHLGEEKKQRLSLRGKAHSRRLNRQHGLCSNNYLTPSAARRYHVRSAKCEVPLPPASFALSVHPVDPVLTTPFASSSVIPPIPYRHGPFRPSLKSDDFSCSRSLFFLFSLSVSLFSNQAKPL